MSQTGMQQVVVPPVSPDPVVSADLQVVVDDIPEAELDSIFVMPGRNEPCHCGSGDKYKNCHLPLDQEAWRDVAIIRREADAACALLRAYPSNRRSYDPRPE